MAKSSKTSFSTAAIAMIATGVVLAVGAVVGLVLWARPQAPPPATAGESNLEASVDELQAEVERLGEEVAQGDKPKLGRFGQFLLGLVDVVVPG